MPIGTGASIIAMVQRVACLDFVLPSRFWSKYTMCVDFCSFTFVVLKNYDLELKSEYSTEILLYALVALDLPYIFYLFEIMIHSPDLF